MDHSRKRILIVEDEALVALDIRRSLQAWGYLVSGVAASGVEAIALAETEKPDLVLMDIRIRGEMDGIETAGILKERFGLCVIYLTAHGDPQTLKRAALTEPWGYLIKPLRVEDLPAQIEAICSSPRRRTGG